jgi:hypothetical protein
VRAAWLAWSVADEIPALQRTFDEAELDADVARLGELHGEDFLSIGEQGSVLGKREWIGRHGEFRYLSIETSEADVRRYGEAAIVRRVQRSRASWRVHHDTHAVPMRNYVIAVRNYVLAHTKTSKIGTPDNGALWRFVAMAVGQPPCRCGRVTRKPGRPGGIPWP